MSTGNVALDKRKTKNGERSCQNTEKEVVSQALNSDGKAKQVYFTVDFTAESGRQKQWKTEAVEDRSGTRSRT